jgi:elongation factor Ts
MVKRREKKLEEGRVVVDYNQDYSKKEYSIFIVGLRCETDFLSRSDLFKSKLNNMCQLKKDKEQFNGYEIADEISKESGERVEFEGSYFTVRDKDIPSNYYLHHDNKKLAWVEFSESSFHIEEIKELAYHIAMHIVAFPFFYLRREDINWEEVDLGIDESILKNKPENIIEKIKMGKKNKYCKENVLLEQLFVKDMNKTVSEAIEEFNKKNNTNIEIKKYYSIVI